MFFHPKLETALRLTCFGCWLLALGMNQTDAAQDNAYLQRMAAMEEARNRAAAGETFPRGYPTAGRSRGPEGINGATMAGPREALPTGYRMTEGGRSPVRAASGVPRAPIGLENGSMEYRMAQLAEGSIVDGSSPIIESDYFLEEDDSFYEEEFGGYSECGDSCGYFSMCGDRGGCPDDFCWFSSLGQILYRGDYFFGAQGFQKPLLSAGGDPSGLIDDSNFGFYGGFNFGLPLCRITCGLFSGQFGVRSVQTNFGGAGFTAESRDQLFMTAGFFRRVDYGFQGGLVYDFMWDNWFTDSQVIQARAELSHLWVGGTSFGFRYHGNASDDNTSGVLVGNDISEIRTFSEDSYRFFLRHEAMGGGFGDFFIGWTDSRQTIVGFALDVPITHSLAAQTGVTYYGDDTPATATTDQFGGYLNEAWNIYTGFSWRPAGRQWYRGYDRPLFDVADNGSMLIRRH